MLCFAVYSDGKPASHVNLAGAYLLGTDDVPLRADIAFKSGLITCQKRAAGPAGLVLLWQVNGVGTMMLETVRVPERKRPYVIQVELARARLIRVYQKLEEWGLTDQPELAPVTGQIREAREYLIRALQADDTPTAAQLATLALTLAVGAGEELSRVHADLLLARRQAVGTVAQGTLGCALHLEPPTADHLKLVQGAFDQVTLPISWRELEPSEQTFNWKPLDAWVEVLAKKRIPMRGSALLSFAEQNIPDWLYIWEHDFDTIRDLAFEHARRVLDRYGQHVQTWDVISGIHAENCFTFNFEQLMELTRMAAALPKRVNPGCTTVIDLVAPWGEYYARNQRTIPPLLYADMVVQSGIGFDAFGLQFPLGPGKDGSFVRDMFQISAMIDQFAKLGKPIHITAVQVPSNAGPVPDEYGADARPPADGGVWHAPWSEKVQAEWLERFLQVAFSKPFVESVSWRDLTDHLGTVAPHGGLLHPDLRPKLAYQALVQRRAAKRGQPRRRPSETESAA